MNKILGENSFVLKFAPILAEMSSTFTTIRTFAGGSTTDQRFRARPLAGLERSTGTLPGLTLQSHPPKGDFVEISSTNVNLCNLPVVESRVGDYFRYTFPKTSKTPVSAKIITLTIGGSRGGVPGVRPRKGPDSFILTYKIF